MDLLTQEFGPDGSLDDKLEWAARFVHDTVENFPEETRPSVVEDLAHGFLHAAEVGIGLDEPEELFNAFSAMNGEVGGHVLMQWLGDKDGVGDPRLKHLAVDVAEVLGPDHAQTLYRFAVLVTKLA